MATQPLLSTELIDQFLSSRLTMGCSSNTTRAYGADLRGFLTWLTENDESVSDDWLVIEGQLARYLTSKRHEYSPSTLARKRVAFRMYCEWMGQQGMLNKFRSPRPAKPEPHPLPGGMADVYAILDACGPDARKRSLVALCGLAGLRVDEAVSVTLDDIDTSTRTLLIRGKGGKQRNVPLSRRAFREIAVQWAIRDEWCGDGFAAGSAKLIDFSNTWARSLLSELGVKAGVARPVASHDLRATFATHMYANCLDIRAVQEYLGHADMRTTQVYTDVNQAKLRGLVEDIFDEKPAESTEIPDNVIPLRRLA